MAKKKFALILTKLHVDKWKKNGSANDVRVKLTKKTPTSIDGPVLFQKISQRKYQFK